MNITKIHIYENDIQIRQQTQSCMVIYKDHRHVMGMSIRSLIMTTEMSLAYILKSMNTNDDTSLYRQALKWYPKAFKIYQNEDILSLKCPCTPT